MDFVSARSVQDDCARTLVETGLRSLRTRRPGPVVGRQKVGAHARLFVDRDEKRRTFADGNKGGEGGGAGGGRGRDRGPETGGPRERQNNPGPGVSLTLVYGRWYVESFVGIGHSVSNATRPLYPAGREMSPRSDFSSSDTDLSREWRSNDRVAASFDRNRR